MGTAWALLGIAGRRRLNLQCVSTLPRYPSSVQHRMRMSWTILRIVKILLKINAGTSRERPFLVSTWSFVGSRQEQTCEPHAMPHAMRAVLVFTNADARTHTHTHLVVRGFAVIIIHREKDEGNARRLSQVNWSCWTNVPNSSHQTRGRLRWRSDMSAGKGSGVTHNLFLTICYRC